MTIELEVAQSDSHTEEKIDNQMKLEATSLCSVLCVVYNSSTSCRQTDRAEAGLNPDGELRIERIMMI